MKGAVSDTKRLYSFSYILMIHSIHSRTLYRMILYNTDLVVWKQSSQAKWSLFPVSRLAASLGKPILSCKQFHFTQQFSVTTGHREPGDQMGWLVGMGGGGCLWRWVCAATCRAVIGSQEEQQHTDRQQGESSSWLGCWAVEGEMEGRTWYEREM